MSCFYHSLDLLKVPVHITVLCECFKPSSISQSVMHLGSCREQWMVSWSVWFRRVGTWKIDSGEQPIPYRSLPRQSHTKCQRLAVLDWLWCCMSGCMCVCVCVFVCLFLVPILFWIVCMFLLHWLWFSLRACLSACLPACLSAYVPLIRKTHVTSTAADLWL